MPTNDFHFYISRFMSDTIIRYLITKILQNLDYSWLATTVFLFG